MPVIYTTPVSRGDAADVTLRPTDLSVETGLPSLTTCIEGTREAGFPDEIAPQPEDYVLLKRRPSAFYGTGVAELWRMLRRDTSSSAVGRRTAAWREAFSMDLHAIVVRECCGSSDPEAHTYSLNKAMKMYARVRTLDETPAMLGLNA